MPEPIPERQYQPPIEGRLTESELQELDREFEPLLMPSNWAQDVRILPKAALDAWLIKKGATRQTGGLEDAVVLEWHQKIKKTTASKEPDWWDSPPILYEQLMCDFWQWDEWRTNKRVGTGRIIIPKTLKKHEEVLNAQEGSNRGAQENCEGAENSTAPRIEEGGNKAS